MRRGPNKQLKVSMSMHRHMNHGGASLRITDEASNLIILEIEIEDKSMLDLITSRTAYAKGMLYTSDKIGKVHECKTVLLPCLSYNEEEKLTKEALRWEKDNPEWEIDKPIEWNGHRHDHINKTFRVIARRYVEPTDD